MILPFPPSSRTVEIRQRATALLPLDWDVRERNLDRWASAVFRQMVKAGVDPSMAKQEAAKYGEAIKWRVFVIVSEELVARGKRGLGMLVPTPEYAALS